MPELCALLQNKPILLEISGMEEALVISRAQWREKERAEVEQDAKEDIEESKGGDDKKSMESWPVFRSNQSVVPPGFHHLLVFFVFFRHFLKRSSENNDPDSFTL